MTLLSSTMPSYSFLSRGELNIFNVAFIHSAPKESGYCQPNGATAFQSDYEAAGTTASCTTQGFFDSFFSGWSVLMNAILALSYFLIVKYGMKDEAQSRRSLALVSAIYVQTDVSISEARKSMLIYSSCNLYSLCNRLSDPRGSTIILLLVGHKAII